MATVCCNKTTKVTDTRVGERCGVNFKRRRRVCTVCDERKTTYEVDSVNFKTLIRIGDIKRQIASVANMLIALGDDDEQ